jgi:hypothetical protein
MLIWQSLQRTKIEDIDIDTVQVCVKNELYDILEVVDIDIAAEELVVKAKLPIGQGKFRTKKIRVKKDDIVLDLVTEDTDIPSMTVDDIFAERIHTEDELADLLKSIRVVPLHVVVAQHVHDFWHKCKSLKKCLVNMLEKYKKDLADDATILKFKQASQEVKLRFYNIVENCTGDGIELYKRWCT